MVMHVAYEAFRDSWTGTSSLSVEESSCWRAAECGSLSLFVLGVFFVVLILFITVALEGSITIRDDPNDLHECMQSASWSLPVISMYSSSTPCDVNVLRLANNTIDAI